MLFAALAVTTLVISFTIFSVIGDVRKQYDHQNEMAGTKKEVTTSMQPIPIMAEKERVNMVNKNNFLNLNGKKKQKEESKAMGR